MNSQKKELLGKVIRDLDLLTDKISRLDDKFFKFCHVQVGLFNEILITEKGTGSTYPNFIKKLKKLTVDLGNYKIDNYWIPFGGTVCVNYIFMGQKVRFTINACDDYPLEKIISKLSNGKCKVTTKVTTDVECSI